jgi:hypothetical protein
MLKKSLSTFAVMAFFAPVVVAAATSDYVNYWSFDDAGGSIVSDSVGNKNGTITGSSTGLGWAGGKSGTALAMDGGAGESVILPNAILSGSHGTISLWFKMDALSYGNMLFSGKSTTENNIYFSLSVDNDGRPQVQFRDTAGGNDRKVQGAKILNINEWYNLVLTANTLTYHMYVNGEEVTVAGENIGRWFPDLSNHTYSYRIGSLDATPQNGVFKGILVEVKVYNRAITFAEMTALYEEGNVGTPTVPLAIRPALAFSISTDHVSYGGGVTVNWSGTNVTSCAASGNWSGTKPIMGGESFSLLASDASYALTCTGQGGSISETVRVIVGAQNATTTTMTTEITGLTAVSLPVGTTPPATQTATMQTTTTTTAESGTMADTPEMRRVLTQKLIDTILILIGELQKQLAILKAAGVH